MSLREFEKRIDQKILVKLGVLGFELKSKRTFLLKLGQEKEGLVVVEKSDRGTKSTLFINPIVCFVNYKVERLAESLAKEFYNSQTLVNTLCENIGYLTEERTYRTWDVEIGESEQKLDQTLASLSDAVSRYSLPLFELLSSDDKLLEVLNASRIGLTILNRIKAPTLLCILGRHQEALELASKILSEIRPTPKIPTVHEPIFATPEEAFTFFKRDQDPRYYFHYLNFHRRLKTYIGNM